MKPSKFGYHRPGSRDEALVTLAELGDDAKVLAGGQSLIPLLNTRIVQPAALVDINGLPGLDRITRTNGHVEIGALARHRAVEQSPVVRDGLPLLAEIAPYIGHVPIRNRGTFGGSMAHADPSAEWPVAAAVLDATFLVASSGGTREVASDAFFRSYFETAVAPGELLEAVRIPVTPAGAGCAFEELSRRHGDYGLAAVAAIVGLDKAGNLGLVRVAVAGGPAPHRAPDIEAQLAGQPATADTFAAFADAVAAGASLRTDPHASSEYRRKVTRVLIRKALARAAERANAEEGSR